MLKEIKTKIMSISGDKKSILALVGATTIAQIFNFILSPIQTRLFSPEVFGELSVFTSITGIISVVICLRYELAIVLPEDDEEGFSLLKLACLFALIISGFSLIIFALFNIRIYKFFNAVNLSQYWYYVPITLLLTGFIQATNYWLIRGRKFSIISYNKVLPALAANLISIGLGFLGHRTISARLFALLISNIINCILILAAILPDIKNRKNSKNNRMFLIKKYKNFFIYDIVSAIFNNLSWAIVPILLNSLFSSFECGQYSLSLRVVQLPMTIIGAAYSQVFLKNASEKYYKGELYKISISTIKNLLLIIIPIFITLAFLGRVIFVYVFGKSWEMGGVYTQILTLYMISAFIANPISTILTIVNKQKIGLLFNLIVLFLRIISLYIGGTMKDSYFSMILFSITGFLFNCFNLTYCIKVAKNSDIEKRMLNDVNNK